MEDKNNSEAIYDVCVIDENRPLPTKEERMKMYRECNYGVGVVTAPIDMEGFEDAFEGDTTYGINPNLPQVSSSEVRRWRIEHGSIEGWIPPDPTEEELELIKKRDANNPVVPTEVKNL